METTQAPAARAYSVDGAAQQRLADAAVWTAAFSLVTYLALSGGGYDTIVHGEVGLVVWWFAAVATLLGIVPRARIGAPAAIALALLGGLVIWTAIGIGSSESAERSHEDLARLATYMGILLTAIMVQGRGALRATVNGVAAAIGLVALLAVLSRLHPAWFPDSATAEFLPGARKRLAYPLNYWNAVAALMAIGVPLLVGCATSAASRAAQALAAAAIPLTLLAAMLTLSRGGAIAVVIGILAYLALAPEVGRQFATLAAGCTGAAVLIVAVLLSPALRDAQPTADARHEGDFVLGLAIVVCLATSLASVAIARRTNRAELIEMKPLMSRRSAVGGVVALAVVAVVVAGATGVAGSAWRDFKNPHVSASQEFAVGRFGDASGSGRYQYWHRALQAFSDHPLQGTGPGTYGFWWARHGDYWYNLRDAHSLYVEKLAEQGLPGFLLIAGFVVTVLWTGIARTLRAPPDQRTLLAAASAAFAACVVMTAIDWVWEVAAVPAAALLLAAVLLMATDRPASRPRRRGAAGWALTAAVVLAGVAAAFAIVPPVTGTGALRASQKAAGRGDLSAALADAARAQRDEPYAASPHLQRALVLERTGDLAAATAEARAAAKREPTNYRPWVVVARLEARQGRAGPAVRAFRRARSLNPHAPALGGS